MIPTAQIASSEDILILCIVLLLAFVGSVAKDYIAAFNGEHRLSIVRILLSTVTACLLIMVFSDFLIDKLGIKGLVGVSFFAGLIGFELLQDISSIDGLLKLVNKITAILSILKEDDTNKSVNNITINNPDSKDK
jgi:hypothetical protein